VCLLYLQKSQKADWVTGRLALSQQSSRFELPMDMRVLESKYYSVMRNLCYTELVLSRNCVIQKLCYTELYRTCVVQKLCDTQFV